MVDYAVAISCKMIAFALGLTSLSGGNPYCADGLVCGAAAWPGDS